MSFRMLLSRTVVSLSCACSSGTTDSVPGSQGTGEPGTSGSTAGGAAVDGSTREAQTSQPSQRGTPSADAGIADAANPADATQANRYARKAVAFDELSLGTVVENQYASWLRWSTDVGCKLSADSAAGVAASKPNYLWTYYSCATGASASIIMSFVKPVQQVSFKLVGVNSNATVATARVYQADGTRTDQAIKGNGSYLAPVLVGLSETSIVKVELRDISDAYGLGLDDLAFDFPEF